MDPREAGATLAQALGKTTSPNTLVALARGLAAVPARMQPPEAPEAFAGLPGQSPTPWAPTAHDRVLATRFGLAAIDAAHSGNWGEMVALRGTRIELIPLAEAVAELRTVPLEDYEAFSALFG